MWGRWYFGRFGWRKKHRYCWQYWYLEPQIQNSYAPNSPLNPYGWGRGFGRGYYWFGTMWYANTNNRAYNDIVSNKDIMKQAQDLIKKAYTIEPFPGAPWVQIVANGQIIGYLWEKIDLKSVSLGSPSRNGDYWSVPILHKSRIIGYIYIYGR